LTHCVVVDTNVFAVAERLHTGASEECVLACVRLVRQIADGQRVAADSADAILREYLGTLDTLKASGIAAKLATRLWRMRHDAAVCHLTDITPIDDPPGAFAEVPPSLQDFDVDDQKFIAVACAVGTTPPIYAALDGEWWERRVDFVAAGVDVQFLCSVDFLA
jgi:hypothetical protein